MTLALTAADRRALVRASVLLTSPLVFPDADEWRRAVNRQLKALFVADTAAFLLPGVDGDVYFSEEHDPAEGAKYVHLTPPAPREGETVWERAVATRVSTINTLYGRDTGRYYASAYYNEYAGANGARHALAAMLPLAPGKPDPHRMAIVSLWRSADTGAGGGPFGRRERQLLELLFPSLSAGVEALSRWHQHRADLLNAVEVLGQAVLVCGPDGRVLHETAALTTALAGDREAAMLRASLLSVAVGAGRRTRPAVHSARQPTSPPLIELRTAHAEYVARASVCDDGRARGSLILVSLERLTPTVPSAEELRRRFGLTEREAEVALLLSMRRTNQEIAAALGVSTHTARHHTENVMRKIGSTSRAEVAAALSDASLCNRGGGHVGRCRDA